jgi:helix-turn-helix protein
MRLAKGLSDLNSKFEDMNELEKNRIENQTIPARNHGAYSSIIADEFSSQRILSAIADPYSRKILASTAHEALGALSLAKECGIPVTTVYRRIEELVRAGLVASVRAARTKDGKWFDLYRSTVKRIDVSSENGTLSVGLVTNEKLSNRSIVNLCP